MARTRPNFPGSPAALLAAWLAGAATPAPAAIYKCPDPTGHVTYQQAPCADGGGLADIRAPEPSPHEQEAARQRAHQDKAAARELEQAQEARRQERLREAERRQRREARCRAILADAEAMERRSQAFGKESARQREALRAQTLRDRHDRECAGAG